ncbi:hypothetical protein HG536_0C01950 [Torulaspora globosa]|uniref:Structural maintenance of chromosomes protein n=1 Tax=Torulaspora globosa TaxID=48254 RepID=A0A7G3ZEU1_9SACH|nr:uncharacterized protein HG536_0C01950 [Torulaspora globosa]QLL32027.1 hypothetical protein HG536_0C01950 [Torulaspora globosa]
MSNSPASKRQKVPEANAGADQVSQTVNGPIKSSSSPSSQPVASHTPRKLMISSAEQRISSSQPATASSLSLTGPELKPPRTSSRGRNSRTYSQSPPRSPGRSPTRKLELIKISPVKKSRLELQRLYDAEQSQKNSSRLCIDKLVLENFKSYAGRQVVGPFHSNFSAVVGPNGSGKSNVIDSMLFVFGFRATKMRQDRLSDLIHNSELHPNLQSCSVEVHFHYVIDQDDGTTRIDEEKPSLIVTRKAFRNNSSKYFVNGAESNYTRVTELLKEEGIDLDHKRFLILQGEVENIAQMKPKAEKEGEDGLLEYLEDITGTAKYKPQIEAIAKQIEVLNESCLEKENRFQIVDQEKSSLEAGKNEALEFLERERNLTLLKSKRLQFKIWQNNKKLCSTLSKSDKLEHQLTEESNKYSETMKEMHTLETQIKEAAKKLELQIVREKTLISQKRDLDQERVVNEEKMKNLSQKVAKTEDALKTAQISIEQSQGHLDKLKEQQGDHTATLKHLSEDLAREREQLDKIKLSLKNKTTDISAEIAQCEKDLEPWNDQLQRKRAEIQLADSELSLLRDKQSRLDEEVLKLESEIAAAIEEKDAKLKAVRELEEQKAAISNEISTGEGEWTAAQTRLKEMHDILNVQRQRTMDARSALSTAQNKSTVLTALTKLQKSGRISGFHGRLGDLGTIDEEYDVAISTACPRLEDLVVESVECGQQCIDYLRKNKLGYARFILLDKLRKFSINPIETPEAVPRLFDLVQPKADKFIPAFYSVLRDTLAANDLTQANRVAYGKKRFRVVTLDGKLIDLSGTMSGGGSFVARGLMKLAQNKAQDVDVYSPEEVAQLEHSLAEKEKNLQLANETFQQMMSHLEELKDKAPEIDLKISKLLLEIESWDTEMQLKQKRLAEKRLMQKKAIENNEELERAEARVEQLKQEEESLGKQTASTKQKIAELKERIMEIGGSELKLQNVKVSSIAEQIESITSKQKKEKSSIKKTENELKKQTKAFNNAKTDLQQFTQEINMLEGAIGKLVVSLEEIETSVQEVQEESRALSGRLDLLKQKLASLEAGATEFKSLKIEIKDRLEKLNALARHLRKEITQHETELENTKIRDVARILHQLEEDENASANSGGDILDKQEPGRSPALEDENKQDHPTLMENDSLNDERMEIDEGAAELPNKLPRVAETELENMNLDDLESQINDLQHYVDSTNVDVEILEEYAKRLAEHKRRKLDLNQAVQERDNMRDSLEDLRKRRFDKFMQGFGIISMTLKEMYQMITMGGNAELELVDSLDPFSEGVTFSVMPPKKSWRNITNLSGGEKTLSSLALVFALHKYKPTPLYVMDEIDAALDFRNVSIVANYIKERTKNAQFVVISLRNNMFELGQQLVGIYKRDNMTKSATLKNNDLIDRV